MHNRDSIISREGQKNNCWMAMTKRNCTLFCNFVYTSPGIILMKMIIIIFDCLMNDGNFYTKSIMTTRLVK